MIAKVIALETAGAALTASAFVGRANTFIIVGEVIVGCAGAWLLIRSRQASQSIADASDARRMAAEWRDNYLAERQAREDKEKEAAEQRELKHAAINEIATLSAQRDLTAVMTALVEIQKTGTKSVELMEKIARRLDRIDPAPTRGTV
jgi:hypothetical protein